MEKLREVRMKIGGISYFKKIFKKFKNYTSMDALKRIK